ncbi:hypothetical protein, partial [Desulfosporosinus sp. I2]|uniref:hypothetical protein n=1 Tax=Desulfosporosinus sp. I2 TaxID=1617025 RepID=UPI001A9A4952
MYSSDSQNRDNEPPANTICPPQYWSRFQDTAIPVATDTMESLNASLRQKSLNQSVRVAFLTLQGYNYQTFKQLNICGYN